MNVNVQTLPADSVIPLTNLSAKLTTHKGLDICEDKSSNKETFNFFFTQLSLIST